MTCRSAVTAICNIAVNNDNQFPAPVATSMVINAIHLTRISIGFMVAAMLIGIVHGSSNQQASLLFRTNITH